MRVGLQVARVQGVHGRGWGRQERNIRRRATEWASAAEGSVSERWMAAYLGIVSEWDVKDGEVDGGAEDGDYRSCVVDDDDHDDCDCHEMIVIAMR